MAKGSAIKEHDEGKRMTRCRIMKRPDEFGERRADRGKENACIITGGEWNGRKKKARIMEDPLRKFRDIRMDLLRLSR